jgi:ribonuclease HI
MTKKSKYYVVWKGYRPGIYPTWETCQQQIKGFEGARYKSYENPEEAKTAFEKGPDNFKKITKKEIPVVTDNSICVDAACSGNPGDMEYRGVETKTGKEIFRVGPFPEGTNNIGEFLAIVHALALLKKLQKNDTVIYTDSQTAMAWVRDKKLKSTLQPTARNKPVFELVERALVWLRQNSYSNKIVKWETSKWGEIPADFGRK